MGLIGRILGVVLALVVAIVAGVLYLMQDANRLKPELQQLASDNSDYNVVIGGDIKWQLFPPLTLNLRDVQLTNEEQQIRVADLDMKMDLSAIWQDIERWRVSELHIGNARLTQDSGVTILQRFDLKDFSIGAAAPFSAAVTLPADAEPTADGAEPAADLNINLDGNIAYAPAADNAPQRITLRDTRISSELATAICEADVTDAAQPAPASIPETDDDVLPLSTLLSYDLTARCNIERLELNGETFSAGTVDVTNTSGTLDLLLDLPEFLGGTLRAETTVNLMARPIRWTVTPDMQGVDSQRLLNFADQRLQWIAPVALASQITLQGNTPDELLGSITARSEFDGSQGQLNVAKIKEQLMRIALLTKKAEEVQGWPDMWQYQQFTGTWNIEGTEHALNFVLDNMQVKADGSYDLVGDALDLLAYVTIGEAPEGSPFTINPLLQDTPIPVRCRGPAADPKCRLDENAAQSVIASALKSDSETGLRRKLEEKIDEEVPEEYRDAARGLLDLLQRSLD